MTRGEIIDDVEQLPTRLVRFIDLCFIGDDRNAASYRDETVIVGHDLASNSCACVPRGEREDTRSFIAGTDDRILVNLWSEDEA